MYTTCIIYTKDWEGGHFRANWPTWLAQQKQRKTDPSWAHIGCRIRIYMFRLCICEQKQKTRWANGLALVIRIPTANLGRRSLYQLLSIPLSPSATSTILFSSYPTVRCSGPARHQYPAQLRKGCCPITQETPPEFVDKCICSHVHPM